jgi:DNA modification methylase
MYKLIHGDCIEVMRAMPDKSVDAIITDPPYGIGVDFGNYADTVENLERLIADALPEMRRVAKRVVLTPGIRNLHKYPGSSWILCWYYAGGARGSYGFNHWQPVLAYGADPNWRLKITGTDVLRVTSTGLADRTAHPCPKPLSFARKLIARVAPSPSDTILDPFLGSGSFGVAAIQLGHNFIGIEQNADYLAIAERRIAAARPDFEHTVELIIDKKGIHRVRDT